VDRISLHRRTVQNSPQSPRRGEEGRTVTGESRPSFAKKERVVIIGFIFLNSQSEHDSQFVGSGVMPTRKQGERLRPRRACDQTEQRPSFPHGYDWLENEN